MGKESIGMDRGKGRGRHQVDLLHDETVWVFWGRSLKIVFGTPLPKKKIIFTFVARRSITSKIVMPPKNNFLLLFWGNIVFLKKQLNEKRVEPQCLPKRLYWFFRRPRYSKRSCLPQMGFSQFSKNTPFFRKTCFIIKTFFN